MLTTLLESQPSRQRRRGGLLTSTVIHLALAALAVRGTVAVRQAAEKPRAERVVFAQLEHRDPPPPPPEARVSVAAAAASGPPIAKGFQVLTAPIRVPDVLPDIDLSKQVTNEADFSGKGVAGGIAAGVVGGVPKGADPASPTTTYFEFQVERQAAVAESRVPRYPEQLRAASIEGEAVVQFVVDTAGHADMRTFTVLRATHDLFAEAARQTLSQFRFRPAEIGGRHVRQMVQMPFVFQLNQRDR